MQNVSQDVRDGCPAGGPQWDCNLSNRQWDLPPFLPNLCLHVGSRLITRTSGQCLCLRVALPRPAGISADAPHHLPPQAEKHHLLFLLCPRLQQRGRELLHQHGNLQHLISEVHHFLTVHLREIGGSTHRHIRPCAITPACMHTCKQQESMHTRRAHRGSAPPYCDIQNTKTHHQLQITTWVYTSCMHILFQMVQWVRWHRGNTAHNVRKRSCEWLESDLTLLSLILTNKTNGPETCLPSAAKSIKRGYYFFLFDFGKVISRTVHVIL